jgi:hypothetical protein
VLFILDFNSEHFAESCNKITFASALIQLPNATVGLSISPTTLYFRLSTIIELRTVYFPDSNISAEISREHLEKRKNHNDIIGEHQETLKKKKKCTKLIAFILQVNSSYKP